MATSDRPADRHRELAGHFTELVLGTTDWDVPAPVQGWSARDVVRHLVEWLPGLLAGDGITLPPVPAVDDDPVAAWQAHVEAVQALLDDPQTCVRTFSNPHIGSLPLDRAIDSFYTTDVFMHSWDLARATAQDDRLDPDRCADLLPGMEPMDQMLRESGQYGPRVPVPDGADVQDRLIAFIGRDPNWAPSSAPATPTASGTPTGPASTEPAPAGT
jgi:uncharacterized protein (TIGR03086 family)